MDSATVTPILAGIVVALFCALAATYSRKALWFALWVSVSLYLLVVVRDAWFGEYRWVASLVLIASATVGAVTFAVVVIRGKNFVAIRGKKKKATRPLSGSPQIKIEVGKDTATFDGRPRPSVALTLRNSGEPFTLVAKVKIRGDSRDSHAGSWQYLPRPVYGRHGTSQFCVATLGQITFPGKSSEWLLKAHGEGMEVKGRWEGPGEFWFTSEWTFFSETDGVLNALGEAAIVRVEVGTDFAIMQWDVDTLSWVS